MKFKWSLFRKIQLIIVIIFVIVFSVSQMIISNFITDNIKSNYEENVSNTSVLLQENIEVIFGDARNSLYFIKKQYEPMNRDDEFIRQYLKVLTDTKDYFINAFVAYNDGSYVLQPYVKLEDDFDPRQREWYPLGYNSRDIVWSEPYADVATQNLVITGSMYLNLGEIDGVIGLDVELSSLPSIINSTKVGDNGFILMINDDDMIIADSSGDRINQSINVLNDPEFMSSELITGYLETEKGIYFLRRLNRTNMRLVAFTPKDDLLSATKQVQSITTLVLLIALLISIILSNILTRRIIKPIEGLKNTMEASLNQEQLLIFDGSTSDEINSLIIGYNTIAQSVNDQKKALKQISNELMISESKLHAQYDKVAELAYFDYLTNLPNRLSFEEEAKLMINNKESFALIYIDLDNFKYINDTYGHNYGDFVLQIISRRLKTFHDQKYFAARLSGDEFGLLVTDYDDLELLAKEILLLINNAIYYNELEFTVTGSIGISRYPDDGKSFEDILSNADIAMYDAKNKTKNLFMIFDQKLRNELMERVNIESNLFSALERKEIFVVYQPLIDFNTKSTKGFEALVRWRSKELGMIYPDVFIPIAEHNLFINEIGYFVLEEAIIFGIKLYEKYGQYFEMNINVSLIQLHLENFIESVISIIEKHDFPMRYVNLEITESVALETDHKIREKLNALRSHGIKISLDDFGTGYSSLNHLISIQLTDMKIDRTIINEAMRSNDVYQLVVGFVNFAHAIGLNVVAEGIEDERTEELVRQMSVDYAQGYLYAKPLIEEDVYHYLDEVE